MTYPILSYPIHLSYLILSIPIQETVSGEGSAADEGVPSLLLEAAGRGDLPAIQEALRAGESITMLNNNGWSAAMFAVGGNHIDALR